MMRFNRVFVLFLLTCTVPVTISASVSRSSRWVVDDYGCNTPDNGAGFCTIQEECKHVQELISNDDGRMEDIWKEYACGVDKWNRYKVCCPYQSSNADRIGEEDQDHSHHDNYDLLPEDCGPVRAWGIFNGNESYLSEFGWATLLKYQKSGDTYACGGTLINDRYILTAARCVKHKFKLIGARLGEYDVRRIKDCVWEYSAGDTVETCAPPVQDFDISMDDATIHPGYNPRTHENDIALVRLRKKADTSASSVSTICLPITHEEKHLRTTKYTAIGWGATEYGLSTPVLLKVITEKVKSSTCQSFYKEFRGGSEEQVCTLGRQGEDSCAVDYGGPLMGYYDTGEELRTIQYGIMGIRPSVCQGEGTPAVYTNLALYVGWILDNIEP